MSVQMKRLNIADEKFSGKKAFGFSLVRLGNILAGLMIGEVTYFATNSLALTAAAISTGVAIKTAIDAVTDLIMGTIVDRTHTKYGKARPYVLAGILMWITLIACFAVPTSWFAGIAPERRNLWMVVYITVFNALHSAIFSTIVNIAYETHIKRSIVKEENRIKSLTVIGIIYAVGSLVLQMALPAIINIFHGSQTGFVLMAVVTAIFGIIACIVCFFLCPEYTEEELAAFGGYDVEEANKKIPISEFLKDVLKNKYLVMYTCINFLYMVILMSSFTTGQYYFQYVFGNLGTFSIVMVMSAILLPLYFFIPKICKRFGVAAVIRTTMIIAVIGVLIRVVAPSLLPTQCIGYLCVSLPNIFVACVGSQINFECMEYGRYKTGVIAEGMYSAFVSFAQKMATSLSSLIIGVILSVSGFDYLTAAVVNNGFTDWSELSALGTEGYEKYVEGGTHTVEAAMSGINFAYNWMPLIFLVICIILFCFFHLERDLKELRVANGLNEDGSMKK